MGAGISKQSSNSPGTPRRSVTPSVGLTDEDRNRPSMLQRGLFEEWLKEDHPQANPISLRAAREVNQVLKKEKVGLSANHRETLQKSIDAGDDVLKVVHAELPHVLEQGEKFEKNFEQPWASVIFTGVQAMHRVAKVEEDRMPNLDNFS
jgi:hypothetical protein